MAPTVSIIEMVAPLDKRRTITVGVAGGTNSGRMGCRLYIMVGAMV